MVRPVVRPMLVVGVVMLLYIETWHGGLSGEVGCLYGEDGT